MSDINPLPSPITQAEFNTLKQGDIIYYLLAPKDLPTHPEKEWKGKVALVYDSSRFVKVISLEEGFEGDSELIQGNQIVRVERRTSALATQ
jgi:hypothetical protein